MHHDLVWESNPVYSCRFTTKKGAFRSLCDNAIDAAGLLRFESRVAAFDADLSEELQLPEVAQAKAAIVRQNSDHGSPTLCLGFVIKAVEEMASQLEAMEAPTAAFLMDDEFEELCSSAEALMNDTNPPGESTFKTADEESIKTSDTESSLENNPGTESRVSVSNVDTRSAYSDSTLPATSDDDTSSETSDITAWKWDLYMSALEEYDFLIHDYNSLNSEVPYNFLLLLEAIILHK